MTKSLILNPAADFARREMHQSLDQQGAQLVLVSRTMLTRVLNAMDDAEDRIAEMMQWHALAVREERSIYRVARIGFVWFCMPATTTILSLTFAQWSS